MRKAIYFVLFVRLKARSYSTTGRMNGRGAYVCSVACLDKAMKTKRLDSALRTKLTEEDCERIAQQLREALSNEDK